MTHISPQVKNPGGTLAPLRNVALFSELVERVVSRNPHLPGMAVFHGPSGAGKTFSAIYAANVFAAYHVEVRSTWTKKSFCEAVLREMGLPAQGRLDVLAEQIAGELTLSRRPLIIDEADNAVSRGLIELIRDIYEQSAGAIIMIGEELLPTKLKRWERVHNRMLDWVGAQPSGIDDARHLAALYCPGLTVADDLLHRVIAAGGGAARRICVNLDRIGEAAKLDGIANAGLAWWGERPLFTGAPPARRV